MTTCSNHAIKEEFTVDYDVLEGQEIETPKEEYRQYIEQLPRDIH